MLVLVAVWEENYSYLYEYSETVFMTKKKKKIPCFMKWQFYIFFHQTLVPVWQRNFSQTVNMSIFHFLNVGLDLGPRGALVLK